MSTIIVGGGWAGLAAAIELSHYHIPVTLLDAAGQLGGRARTIHYRDTYIDNGQHLILGAYQDTLRLLQVMGVREDSVFERRPLTLEMHQAGHPVTRLALPRLPAPLHLLAGLATAQGINMRDRWHALGMCRSLFASDHLFDPDLTVLDMLQRSGQGKHIIETLWQPLCLAVLNTPVTLASAEVFISTLHDAFCGKRRHSDLLFARTNLGNILPAPAQRYVTRHGGTVLLRHRVRHLQIENAGITGVELTNGAQLHAAHVILAVPPSACEELLQPHPLMGDIVAKLAQFDYAPICTVYLRYPATIRLTLPMIGLISKTGQWMFDRGYCGQAGLMAVVISSIGPHMQMDNAALCALIVAEISTLFSDWPAPTETYVVRERRATFLCRTGINSIRPSTVTPVRGCLLAGDFTATDYPATLEGAVRSGIRAARHIIDASDA